ncbi:Protein rcc2 [Chamberlinius hualienensis]
MSTTQKRELTEEENSESKRAKCDENLDGPAGSTESNKDTSVEKDNGGTASVSEPKEDDITEDQEQTTEETNSEDGEKLEKKKFRLPTNQPAGVLLFSGGTNWDLVGRRELPKNAKGAVGRNLWGPHRLTALQDIRVRVVVSGNTACHCVIVTEEGKVMTWGRNDKGQLGHSDTKRRDVPTVVEELKHLLSVDAACGRGHTLVLTDHGHVYSFGDNKNGQCGIGSNAPTVTSPHKVTFKGRPVQKISCGAEFSCMVDFKGYLFSFGCPEYGQLGHNTDGRYFITNNKLAFRSEVSPRRVGVFIEKTREGHIIPIDEVRIADVACGANHVVAMDTKKRCYTWGFGGYGRLGHSEPKDEMIPRLLKFFDGPNRGITAVYAGGAYSMAVSELGCLYFWGQNKVGGEATMYPKPVHDLSGWRIRFAACSNRSIVVLADESVVSWGPSPTYGELCYGENRPKSSTTPQEVKPLENVYIHTVACGFGHTLLIARDDTDEEKAKLKKFPEYAP